MKQLSSVIKILSAAFVLCIFIFPVPSANCQTPSRPNILVILLDDARYDSFGPTGGPDFFNTPAISSIADEGASFKNFFVTTAVCGPSRASIYTGLYSHHHGCRQNGDSPNPGLTYVSTILKNAGYYTGFIGKWLLNYTVPDLPVGFNYYAVTDSFKHTDPVVQFKNGSRVQYYGYDSEIYTDLALDFLNNKVPDGKPWLLFMAHRVPHTPYQRRAEDSTRYDNETKPFPSNFDYYQKDFPSHLYPGKEYLGNSDSLDEEIEEYFETCYSANESTDSLLTWLSSHHELDSTLIIFTSDNGYLFGEHHLHLKLVAYEESMHVPMFIRYPEWFQPGTVIENEFANNIDIAPTLLEAAGIADTFDMDGVSLHALATGAEHRKYHFFEYIPLTGLSWEAVRSFQYKYIKCYCTSQAEEFFDLLNDPAENMNLIFDPNYASLISQYRYLLDSLRTATDDNINPSPGNCSLNSFFYLDADEDSFGNNALKLENKSQPSGYVADRNDCDDANSTIHPGANDLCNSVDDDCDGVVDQHAITATVTPGGTISACDGTPVTLTANPGEGISYQWMRNNKIIAGETNQTYKAKKDAKYFVNESNSFDCAAISAKTTLVVNPVPTAVITPLGNTDICSMGSVVLQASSGAGYMYQWKKGSNIQEGATNQTYTATKKGTYKVDVTNPQLCLKTSAGINVTKSCKAGESKVVADEFDVFPNPFTTSTTISFSLDESTPVAITLTDVNGRTVAAIAKHDFPSGNHQLAFDRGSLTVGIYFLQMKTGEGVMMKKLIVE